MPPSGAEFDRERAGPSSLLGLIEMPRRGYFAREVALRPVLYSAYFAVAMLGLGVTLSLAQAHGVLNDATVDLLPHECVIILLIGVTAFPLRMIAVPLVLYVLSFSMQFFLRLWIEPDYLIDGVQMWPTFAVALLGNGAAGLLAALGGRAAATWVGEDHRQAHLVLSGTTTLLYVLLAGAGVWLATHHLYRPEWLERDFGLASLVQIGALRALRIALCSGVLLLFLLDMPTKAHVRAAVAFLPAFVGAGLLERWGWSIYPPIDIMLLCLSVAAFAAAYAAILANILGLSAYVSLTGTLLLQEPIATPAALRLELVSVLLIILTYLLLLSRHQAHQDAERKSETLDRMQRINSFATIGYFVFDADRAMIYLDPVGSDILHISGQIDAPSFLDRVKPSDRPRVATAMAERSNKSDILTFSVTRTAQWEDGGTDTRHLWVYTWYETLWDGRVVAYGALLDRTADHERATALNTALADLSEQQNRQTQLFSIVSHELRTPASVISMLTEELDGGASWAQLGPRMKAVSEVLLSVLADMRQAVRPEENLPVRPEPFRPRDLAETVRNSFLLMAEGRGMSLTLDLSADAACERVSDRVRLNQVLSNLVKNAILHSGGRVVTIAYAEEDAPDGGLHAVWSVTDDGSGIPESDRPRLFLPFSRIVGATETRADGSGLGLYVARSAVGLLGGTVRHDAPEGGGSRFVVTLPLSLPAPPPAAAAPVEDDAAVAGLRVLVVEDSDLIAELLIARLRRIVAEVEWANSGSEGLLAFDRMKPDVVLTDLFMPEMGGDEMTTTLRATGATCPIIGMTAAAIGDERSRFEAAGTDFVLTKPVSTAQLIEALSRVAGQREVRSDSLR